MREVHNIICSEQALEEFVEWLPDLGPNERFFLCLQARKKYMPSLKSGDKTQLKRFTSSKELLITKIKQLECPVGCYRTKEGEIIPDSAMALYITLNPRDMQKATFSAAKALIDLIQKQNNLNPHSEVLSCIHKSKGQTSFVHFDVDDADWKEVKESVVEIVGNEAVTMVETRGGCHLLVDPKKVVCDHKNWYTVIMKKIKCDQTGDLMVPVVGCNQGGFVPKLHMP